MSSPTDAFAHDHRELSGLLFALRDALGRVDRGVSTLDDELHEIRDGIEAFREALLEHFAREQEGLLPFVLARLPAASARVDQLIAEHDRIAEMLTKLVKDVHEVDAGDVGAFRSSLERFEALYAAHSKTELAFLDDVATRLADDARATAQLRALLDEP